ncbi:MAG TPA: hypothetical protein DDZ51_16525 [Planctomycetaceae bacterium]|nr:hypothetical protein [Planctomycetaceae bacterium]
MFFAFATIAGCDAISHTYIVVRERSLIASEPLQFEESIAVRIVEEVSAGLGFKITKSDKDGLFLNDIVAGENPHIFIMAMPESNAIRIEIAEMYISSPTEKHQRLVDSLIQSFNTQGLDAEIIYRSESSPPWILLFLITAFTLTLAVWATARAWRRRSQDLAMEP